MKRLWESSTLRGRRLRARVTQLEEQLASRDKIIAAREKSLERLQEEVRGKVGDLTRDLEAVRRELNVCKISRGAAQQWIVRLYQATGQAHVIGPDTGLRDPTIRHALNHPRLKQLLADAVETKGVLDEAAVAAIYDTLVHTESGQRPLRKLEAALAALS